MKLIPHPAFPEAIRRAGPITLDVETVLDGRKPWPEWSGYRVKLGTTDAVVDLGDEDPGIVMKYLRFS